MCSLLSMSIFFVARRAKSRHAVNRQVICGGCLFLGSVSKKNRHAKIERLREKECIGRRKSLQNLHMSFFLCNFAAQNILALFPVGRLVGVTLLATPAVRSQKSIGFSIA